MYAILVEGNWVRDFDRHSPDFDLDPRGSKHCHEFLVKLGYGARRQRKCLPYPIACLEHKLMLYEVKPEFECCLSIGEAGGGQAPDADVYRDVPPVVHERRQTQPDLANHLGP